MLPIKLKYMQKAITRLLWNVFKTVFPYERMSFLASTLSKSQFYFCYRMSDDLERKCFKVKEVTNENVTTYVMCMKDPLEKFCDQIKTVNRKHFSHSYTAFERRVNPMNSDIV